MARIAGVNIPNHQHIVIGLTAIFGIGRPRAEEICAATGVDPTKKVKDLDDNDLEKLRDEIGKFVIEGDLRREVSMSIKRLMDVVCVIAEGCLSEVNVPVQMREPEKVHVRPLNH